MSIGEEEAVAVECSGHPGRKRRRGTTPAGAARPALAQRGRRRRRGGNELKERFLASEAFASLYDDAYAELYGQLYGSGTAAGLLDRIAAVVPTSDGLTPEELALQAETLRTFIQERTAALKDQV